MTTGVREQPRRACPRPWPAPRAAGLVGWLTALALLAGIGYRVWLLRHAAPPTNSDEATMGLAALHIARGQDFPVWFYGQQYMGTLEAYLAAPVFAVAGPSLSGLRLPTLALYAVFVLLAWRLTLRLTGDRWFGLLVVVLLALGSDRVVKNQLIAGGGYPEMTAAGVALALLAVDLATGRPGRRLPRWAAWGFLAGLMLWVDPLVLPYIAATAAVLVAYRRRELRGAAGVLLGLAALVGAAPMLTYSLWAGHNPLSAVLTAGGADAAASWADRLHGGLLLGPPLGMGFCAPGQCATWQLWWALALPVLLAVAAASAWRALRAAPDRRADLPDGGGPLDGGRLADGGGLANGGRLDGGRVGAAVRLALVVAAVATLGSYTVSSAAGRTPVESSRYLSCLLISLPALLWPVWTVARRGLGRRPADGSLPSTGVPGDRPVDRSAVPGRWTAGRSPFPGAEVPAAWHRAGWMVVWPVAVALLVATVGSAGCATWRAAQTAPAARAAEMRHAELVATLRQLGVRHVRAGYWTCNRLTFASAEQVVCAVVDDELNPGFDRYPAYRREVGRSAAPAWVAPVGSPLAARLDDRLRTAPARLDLVTIDGWRIYLPRV
ncbi:hypothetical protein ACFOW4_24995 [Micromonospora sp. GCM10011542]|uniref:hypothetical protein n=1 Tax=Micromonospora sp. GCM10011542 TaxID=3317337 RepID=UPI0036158713